MQDTSTERNAEVWRPVVGLESAYSVSDLGRVKRTSAARGTRAGRILKPSLSGPRNKQRLYVGLCDLNGTGVNTHVALHRLVAAAFHGPCPDGHEVNHINGDRFDNRAANLEYLTPQENAAHAIANRLQHRKFADDDVRDIRFLLGWLTPMPIARLYGVACGTICNIQSGTTYAWLD